MIAKQLLTDLISPLKVSETGTEALYYMDEYKISFIPVTDNESFLGLISEADIFNLEDPDRPLADQKVPYKNFFVREHQHIFDVIKTMSSEKITVLPVLDEKDHYLGCITANILNEHFADFASVANPGAIIILELNQKDYVLSQIAQIVESQDAKILSLYITPQKNQLKWSLL